MNERAQHSEYTKVSNDFLNYHSMGDLLPYESYDEEYQVFINERSYGFILEVGVFTGFSEELERELNGLFQSILPLGSSIQFLLVASSKIGNILDNYHHARVQKSNNDNITILAKERIDFLEKKAMTDGALFRLRNFRLIVSCSLLLIQLGELDLQRLKDLRAQVETVFAASGVGVKVFDPTDLIRFLDELLNCNNSIKNSEATWNRHQSIKSQIIDINSIRQVSDKALKQDLDEWEYRVYSVKKYPDEWYLGGMGKLIGDSIRDLLKIPCQFAIHYGVHIENSKLKKAKLLAKGARVESQASSILGKWIPSLAKEAREFQFIREQLEEDHRLVKTFYQVLLIDRPKFINKAEQLLMTLYRSNKWELILNRFTILYALFSMLPLTWAEGIEKDMTFFKRSKTTLSHEPVNLLPIQAEFKGTKTPGFLFTGRCGQLFYWYPFDNRGGNYNVGFVGRSGGGKSVAMQEFANSIVGFGGCAYVLDIGKSFKKLVNYNAGQFIEFSTHSQLCLNPFSTINENSEEDIVDSLSMLKPIISLMAAPKGGTNDDEDAIIERGLNYVWQTNGKKSCINDLTEWLLKEDDALANRLGKRLFTYSKGGAYSRFFNGQATVNFDSNFIVVELEEIKAKKDLLAVVMQIFMLLMINKLSLGDRLLNRAIIVDEAWSAFEGKQGRDFMVNFARTIRKLKGSLAAGTQNINDFYESPAAEVVFNNLDWLCLFSQRKEAIALLKESKKFLIDDYTQKLLSSVRTKHGEYSEMMILHEDGAAIGRLILDPFSRILYTTTPEEFTEVERYQHEGLSLTEAIKKVAVRRYGDI